MFPQILLTLAAVSVALTLALAGCGGVRRGRAIASSGGDFDDGAHGSVGFHWVADSGSTDGSAHGRTGTAASPVYSGRSQSLVHPLLEAFGESTGIAIRVKYAGSPEIAATILEEGDNTPADVVFLQDPGSLGILAAEGVLAELPRATLDKVDARLRDPNGRWIADIRSGKDHHLQH